MRTCTVFGLCLCLTAPLASQTFRIEPTASLIEPAVSRAGPRAPMPAIAFGSATAVVGEQLLVGRSGIVSGFPVPALEAGAVHVFQRGASGRWTEVATVRPADGATGDGFGSAIAADGPWIAVSAPAANDGRGAVYLFERDRSGTWVERGKLGPADASADGRFGAALAMHRDRLFVGSPGQAEGQGLVLVYRRDGGRGWTEEARLMGSGLAPGDAFGSAVTLAGDVAVIGAPGPTPGGGPFGGGERPRAGAAFVFERAAGGGWKEAVRLEGDSTARLFGVAVAAGEMGVFVAMPLSRQGGAVLRFRRDGAAWAPAARIAPDSAEPQAHYGLALALDGHDLLVGAPMSQGDAGAVYVMHHDAATDTWTESQRLTTRGVGFGTRLGAHLAAGGGLAVAGAPVAAFLEGEAIVYVRSGDGTWTEAGTVAGDAPTALGAVTGGKVDCTAGTARSFTCQNVDLVAFLPSRDLGAQRGIWINDLWGWSDPRTGREYAIVGRADATTFVDVTDPASPVYVGELPLTEGARPNLWRDIKVYANHAFIVADGAGPHGMQVFDLTRLRNVAHPPVTFDADARYDGIHSAHNIVIDTASGFAYTVGNSMGGETCGGALHMIDIRDPKHPSFAGCFADPATGNQRTGYTHDAQCVVYQGPDETYRGRQICFNSSETALGIADVSDKTQPKAIASATYPNVQYAHQGWLSDDHRYFYLNDEGDELSGAAPRTRTLIFDVQDLDDPVMVEAYLGETKATDHNLYVKGRYMYQSNYVSGLRVIDVSSPTHPVEVGYFDTVPFGENAPGFAGSWSNYPFFKSGVIAVTSIREGLFLLRFNPRTPVP